MQLTIICNRLYELIEQIETEGTGEVPAEFEQLEKELVNEADEIGKLILTKESEIDDYRIVGNSYLAKASTKENQLKAFKSWLAKVVEKFGNEEKSGKKWLRGKVVGIKDNSVWKLKITDEEKIPIAFKTAFVSVKCSVEDGLKIIKKLLPMKAIEVDTKQIIDKKKLDESVLEQGFELEGVSKYYENRILVTGYKK